MTIPELYIDLMSQPCRAIILFCKLANIPYKQVLIKIRSGETRTKSFKKINSHGKVPAMKDGDYILSESHAIMRYLADKYKVDQHWYPRDDIKQRSRIDEYLDWHHRGTRYAATVFVGVLKFFPIDEKVVEKDTKIFNYALKHLNNKLEKNEYLCGDEITIADLSCICELAQLEVLKFDYSKYPNIYRWMNKIKKLREYKETCVVLEKVKIMNKKVKSSI